MRFFKIFFKILIITIFFLTGCSNNNGNVNNNVSNLSNEQKSIKYLEQLGLNLEDYFSKDVSTSKMNYIGNLKTPYNNYINFTVDNINNIFSKEKIEVRSIINFFGKPDTIFIMVKGEKYYVDLYWNKGNSITDNYVKIEYTELNNNIEILSVFGTPSDSNISGQFLGIEGFTRAE